MKRYHILIINYHYPPIISGGTQRVYNFRKYLPQYGIDVSVLTTNSFGKLEEEEEGIIRFPDRGYDFTQSGKPAWRILLFRIWRRLQAETGMITDGKYYWKKEVLKDIDAVLKENQFDAVIASYPSAANFEIGEYIHNIKGIPLITDYRDGISHSPFPSKWWSFIAQRRLISLEKRIEKITSLNITVNNDMNQYYLKEYPKVRSVMISNGFDDEEEVNEEPIQLPSGINIIYTGGIAKSRMVYDFETVTSVLDTIFSMSTEINYTFIGEYEEREIAFFEKYSNVYVHEKVERKTILATQEKADAFLLISGPKGGTSGKLYEYLFAKKPILNIGGQCGIAELINGINYGITVEPIEKEKIKLFLNKLILRKLSFDYPYHEEFTRRYQSKVLAREIINVLSV